MIYPSADKLEGWGSKYALVTLAAKRAKQLKSGAPAMISTDSRNPLTVALEEIAAGKITCDIPDIDVVATPAMEPEVAELLAIPIETEEEEEEIETTISTDEEIVSSEEAEELEEEEEEEEVHDAWAEVLGEVVEAEAGEEEPAIVEEDVIAPPVDLSGDVEDIAEIADEEEDEKAEADEDTDTDEND